MRSADRDMGGGLAPEARLRAEIERDRNHDECGVFGIHGHPEAARITYLGLYALQHRGQESAGIVCSNGREHAMHRAMGLVADTFNEKTLNSRNSPFFVRAVRGGL